MSRYDWFRNESWTPEIEKAFEAKLRRARHKTQYLRLQAGHLTGTHPDVALALIDQYFAEGGDLALASAHEIRARAYLSTGRVPEAIDAYEMAVKREKEFPNWRTRTAFDLPKLIVDRELTEIYPRAAALLDEVQSQLVFPVDRYIWAGATALILDWQGRVAEAQALANEAIAASATLMSGFRYHPDVGLVQSTQDAFGTRIKALAGRKPGEKSGLKRKS